MPDPIRHTENRGAVEDFLRRIPGFKGYLEKQYRRDSDALQRQWLADQLVHAKQALDDVTRALVDAGQVDILPQFDRARGRLDKLVGRIRGAVRGYSGWFDLVNVDEAVLDRVYKHDLTLSEQLEGLVELVEPWRKKPTEAVDALAGLLGRIDALDQEWDDRDVILKGLE
ncbi:MAG TPA: hypothetical protein VGX76_20590 [Pirellulales bacterium]|jgi:hypothetical protein|nr:hypothetical protein [Pirellulales bacterium]